MTLLNAALSKHVVFHDAGFFNVFMVNEASFYLHTYFLA